MFSKYKSSGSEQWTFILKIIIKSSFVNWSCLLNKYFKSILIPNKNCLWKSFQWAWTAATFIQKCSNQAGLLLIVAHRELFCWLNKVVLIVAVTLKALVKHKTVFRIWNQTQSEALALGVDALPDDSVSVLNKLQQASSLTDDQSCDTELTPP